MKPAGESQGEPNAGAPIDEDALVAILTGDLLSAARGEAAGVLAGSGDDCAVLSTSDASVCELLKTDAVVAGVHFSVNERPERVGRKALCRVLSDIAAMAGRPRAALVTLALPRDFDLSVVEGWYRGLRAAAEQYEVALVGGETTSTIRGDAMISVAMSGTVETSVCLRRSEAKVGDQIAVTGKLGGSLASGRHLDFEPRLREARWLVEQGFRPTAMMDLSDGLAKDLPRLARASGVGYRLDIGAIPRHDGVGVDQALGDGEDYELLMTFAPGRLPPAARWAKTFPEVPLTVIGEVTESVETPLSGGWDHFEGVDDDRA